MFRSVQFDYSQAALIDKINQYQTLKSRTLISERGYCHGLAVLWLVKMQEKDVRWFYQSVKNIIIKKPEDYDEIEFEKFLARIEWGQNPISSGLNITHVHLKELLDVTDIRTKDEIASYADIGLLIRRKKHPAMYMIINEDHAVAVFQCGDSYLVYDSNYRSGCAEVFYDNGSAVREIVRRLYLSSTRADGEFKLRISYIPLNDLLHQDVIDIPEEELPSRGEDQEIQNDDTWTYRCTIL